MQRADCLSSSKPLPDTAVARPFSRLLCFINRNPPPPPFLSSPRQRSRPSSLTMAPACARRASPAVRLPRCPACARGRAPSVSLAPHPPPSAPPRHLLCRRRAARRLPVDCRPPEAPGYHGRHGPEGRLRRRRGAVQARRADAQVCVGRVGAHGAAPRLFRAPPRHLFPRRPPADPIEHGIVTNWDDMEKIWHHT